MKENKTKEGRALVVARDLLRKKKESLVLAEKLVESLELLEMDGDFFSGSDGAKLLSLNKDGEATFRLSNGEEKTYPARDLPESIIKRWGLSNKNKAVRVVAAKELLRRGGLR